MVEVESITLTEDDMSRLRKAYTIGFTKAAINRAIMLNDCTWLPEVLELMNKL
jgi:hypothetical protein